MPIFSPTTFDVKCECGKEYHASDEHIGKYVKCDCGRRIPIQRPAAIERHSAVDDPRPSPPATPKAPSPIASGASKLETLSRFIFCVSAFLAFALLLSKLLLLAARHWSMYLPSRRVLHANLNAALLVAVGFAAASGLVNFWAGHKGTIAGCVSKRVRSVWLLLGKGKSALQRLPLPWKVISALVLCCTLAAAVFWFYHSQQPDNSSQIVFSEDDIARNKDSTPPVRWDDGQPSTGPAVTERIPSLSLRNPSRSRMNASSAVVGKRAAPAQAVDQRPTAYNSLPTGTRITPDIGTNGHGTLMVINGTSEDAVVRLYDIATHQTVLWFSVQAGSSAQRTQLPEGTYILAYTTGLDWLESEDAFQWHPSYSKLERQLRYTERPDSEGIVQYHEMTVTLNPAIGGNIRTKAISREEFLKGHHHTPLQR